MALLSNGDTMFKKVVLAALPTAVSIFLAVSSLRHRLVYESSEDIILGKEMCKKTFWVVFRKVVIILKT